MVRKIVFGTILLAIVSLFLWSCTQTSADTVPKALYDAEVTKVQALQSNKDSILVKLDSLQTKVTGIKAKCDAEKLALKDSLDTYYQGQLNTVQAQYQNNLDAIDAKIDEILKVVQ